MSLPKDWNQGGGHMARGQGKPNLRDLMNGLHGVADLTALKAIDASERSDGMMVRVVGAGQPITFKWVDASALTGDDLLVIAAADAPATGRWIVCEDMIDLKLAVDFNKADAAVLYTVPAGFTLQIGVPWWEVTTPFAGGAASAIGLSSSNAGLNTKGDILGGAGGDVAATLVATGQLAKGTKGTKIGTPSALIVAGETIRFDRITSVFTSGVGFAHVPVYLIATP
jgi:hypothetical protein